MAEAIVGVPMEIDHLIPEALGGVTEEKTSGLPVRSATTTRATESLPLTPPRARSFACSIRAVIEGLTPTGRATVIALHLNRPVLVRARQAWVKVGWHPPRDSTPEGRSAQN